MGEQPHAGHVADGPQPFAGRKWASTWMPCLSAWTPTVSRPIPSTRGRRPVATSRRSPRKFAAVGEREDVVVAVASGRRGLDTHHQFDTVAAQHFAERLAQRGRFMGEQVRGPLDQSHLTTQAAHGLGHLDPDRPTTQYQEAPGHRLHAGDLSVGPDAFQPGQARDRGHDRIRAGGHDDVPGGVGHAVHFDDTRSGQSARAAQQIDSLVRQPALLAGIGVVRDHEVAVGQCCLDVHLGAGGGLACLLGRLPGAQQRLGRDARPVGALTAGQLTLDDGHPQPAIGQLSRTVLARGAGAQDDDVVAAHVLAPGPT